MMIIKKKLMRKQHFLLISGKHCSRNGIVPLNPLGVKESIAAKAAVKAITNSLIISKHPTPMTIQLHPQCLLGIQSILRI